MIMIDINLNCYWSSAVKWLITLWIASAIFCFHLIYTNMKASFQSWSFILNIFGFRCEPQPHVWDTIEHLCLLQTLNSQRVHWQVQFCFLFFLRFVQPKHISWKALPENLKDKKNKNWYTLFSSTPGRALIYSHDFRYGKLGWEVILRWTQDQLYVGGDEAWREARTAERTGLSPFPPPRLQEQTGEAAGVGWSTWPRGIKSHHLHIENGQRWNHHYSSFNSNHF